jgi:hypothetical protein
MLRSTSLLCIAALLSAGCLSSTYRIPKDQAMALTQVQPAQRGQSVRVIQNWGGADEPPEATAVSSNTTVIIVADGPGPTPSGGGGGGGSYGQRPGGGYGPSAKAASDDSKAWIVLAVIAGVALAVTEGARYDGWVQLHPMHPVHLLGPYGQYMVVPLAQLTPDQVAWADRVVVRESEGPWSPLRRAPLDRVGFTYSVLLGQAGIASYDGVDFGDPSPGFQGHIQFGFFPAQQVGLQLDFGLGWRNNSQNKRIFDGRYALELDVLPLSAGKLHAGLYGSLGLASHIEDGGPVDGGPADRDTSGNMWGAGLLGQLELTTRLAVTVRAGYARVLDEPSTELSIGLSIY